MVRTSHDVIFSARAWGMALVLVTVWFTSALAQDDAASEPPALEVGDEAPGFELETFGGDTVSLDQFQGEQGKSVVLVFVRAHW